MTSVRSRLSVNRVSPDCLRIQISPLRRAFYGVISAVLLAGLFSGGVEPLFAAGLHPGTVFYLVVVAIALGAAGWNVQTVLDRHAGVVTRIKRLFGVVLSRRDHRFPDLTGMLVRRIVLFRGSRTSPANQRPNLVGFGRGGIGMRRRELGRLYLESDEARPELIEESTDLAELWVVAEQMSEFTGLSVRSEEV